MSLLVTGGAGYIGSVILDWVTSLGEPAVVLDNLSRGFRDNVAPDIPFFHGDVGNPELVKRIAREHQVDTCVHFAAYAYVGESVEHPRLYVDNNMAQGLALLGALVDAGVKQIVFSSSCATYGEPQYLPIDERHPQIPTNPYGWSKLLMERVLEAYSAAYGVRYVALRYFNAAGATDRRRERHDPETHLIPNVLRAAAGKIPAVKVFGDRYETPDGTAVRDYIHVSDLASAHQLAVEYLRRGGPSVALNLGNGQGYSIMEVIQSAERVAGARVPYEIAPARPGDPSRLVASAEQAHAILGWSPKISRLDDIVRSAWEWFAQPTGSAGSPD